MSALTDKLLLLTKQLYPTGRAWKLPFDGVFERLHKALIISEAQAYTDAVSTHDCILPDNANFTTQDAYDWETRLGLIHNESISLADRMLAIKRKLNQPGVAPAKSNWRYLEKQLRAAGFDVYVHENRFDDYPTGYITMTPFELTGDTSFVVSVQHGDFQTGDYQHGGLYSKFVANHIDEATDWSYDITNLRKTFYIGGVTAGDFANVDATRKNEFRQLILTIKPTHTVGFLLINYV
jgi:uncharacterized protein YmfQ (DUF2313 family)